MNPLILPDGRTLEVRVSGPEDGLPLVFHHGVPATLPSRGFERAVHSRPAASASIRVIRPGPRPTRPS
jgi:hypothetical protein